MYPDEKSRGLRIKKLRRHFNLRLILLLSTNSELWKWETLSREFKLIFQDNSLLVYIMLVFWWYFDSLTI